MQIEQDDIRRVLIYDLKDKKETLSSLSETVFQGRKEQIELDGRKQFFELRNRWSYCIIGWISVLLLTHIGIALGIGFQYLNFESYQWLMPMLIIENFLEIVGMGYIVVQFLYPSS